MEMEGHHELRVPKSLLGGAQGFQIRTAGVLIPPLLAAQGLTLETVLNNLMPSCAACRGASRRILLPQCLRKLFYLTRLPFL